MHLKPNFKWLWLLLPLLAACKPANEGTDFNTEEKLLPYSITTTQLKNKLNVVTVEYPSPGLASFYIVLRVGSREEVEAGKTGFAHFFEHMMFRGTKNHTKEAYNKILKSVGAAANANTWLDRTVYHMTGNAEKLETMFMLEADRFMNLAYSEQDFKVEAGAVKGEYTKNYASPYQQLNEKAVATAFKNHTYGHTTMGYWEDVVDMPNQFDYSKQFFDRFYRPEYATILVVGDVKPEQVEALSEKYFGMWETGSYAPSIPTEAAQTATRYAHVQKDNFPPYLSLRFVGPAFNAEAVDNAALDVIAKILFSEKSDLYKDLVVKEQKVYGIGGGGFYTRDPYLWSVSSSFKDPNAMQEVKDRVMAALEKIKSEPVSEKLLKETVSNLKYSTAMTLDSPSNIAEELSYFIWVSGSPYALNTFYAQYDKLTPEDIMQTAQKYFTANRLTVATIGPDTEGGVQ